MRKKRVSKVIVNEDWNFDHQKISSRKMRILTLSTFLKMKRKQKSRYKDSRNCT